MPVTNEAEALAFLDSVKKHYPDARHHVYAYIVRENAIMRFSDDGEPQGTAGIPILDIIKKRGLTDIAVVVTRYFGGTLLGTGGLVRAYGKSAKDGVKIPDEFAVGYGLDYDQLGRNLKDIYVLAND